MDADIPQAGKATPQIDTQHEPHEHAPKRVIVGVVAVVVVFVLGGVIWSKWGPQIEKVCFGDDESCEAKSVGEYAESALEYDTSAFVDEQPLP